MPVVDMARPRQRILQKDFKLVEFAHRRWAASLQEGQSLADAMVPEFWSNVARGDQRSMMAGDVIEVRAHDHSFFAELYARKVDQGSALMALIRTTDFVDRKAEAKAAKDGAVLEPRWNVGQKAFDVVRTSDKEVVSGGHKLKEDALAWIDDHLKKLRAA